MIRPSSGTRPSSAVIWNKTVICRYLLSSLCHLSVTNSGETEMKRGLRGRISLDAAFDSFVKLSKRCNNRLIGVRCSCQEHWMERTDKGR
jgi:hypothetical protein